MSIGNKIVESGKARWRTFCLGQRKVWCTFQNWSFDSTRHISGCRVLVSPLGASSWSEHVLLINLELGCFVSKWPVLGHLYVVLSCCRRTSILTPEVRVSSCGCIALDIWTRSNCVGPCSICNASWPWTGFKFLFVSASWVAGALFKLFLALGLVI